MFSSLQSGELLVLGVLLLGILFKTICNRVRWIFQPSSVLLIRRLFGLYKRGMLLKLVAGPYAFNINSAVSKQSRLLATLHVLKWLSTQQASEQAST